jgi:MFS family permease
VERNQPIGLQSDFTTPRSAIRKLAFSRGVTYAGGNAAFFALSAILYQQTHSVALVAAAALASFSVPALLSPVAGLLGDHCDRRRVMIGSELAGAVLFLGMALASPSPMALLGLRILASIAWSPLEPATNAALPSLVPERELDRANAAVSKAGIAGCLIGSAAAGAMLTVIGGASVFVLNSVSFLISAAMISSIRGDFRPRATARGKMAAGFAFLRGHPILRPVTIAYAVTFVGVGVSIPAEIAVADEFGAGAWGYAAMFTLWGVGGVIGASFGGRLGDRTQKVKIIAFASLGIAGGLVAVGAAPVFAVVLLGMVAGGVGEGLWEVAQTSLAQRVTPDGIRGRVFAASGAAMQASIAGGLLASGPIAASLGAAGAFAAAGAIAAAGTLVLQTRAKTAESRALADTISEPDALFESAWGGTAGEVDIVVADWSSAMSTSPAADVSRVVELHGASSDGGTAGG